MGGVFFLLQDGNGVDKYGIISFDKSYVFV